MTKADQDIDQIKKALKGQQKAFQQLYERHKHGLFLVCLRYAPDRSTAQDYLQESFIRIFKKLEQFDESKGAFEPWAKRVCINVCLGNVRRQTLYSVGISVGDEFAEVDNDAMAQLSLQEMLALIQRLPYGYKTIFNMYVIDGYSHKEIAAELGISISTSKSQLSKARNLLQKKILNNQRILRQEHG